jgi:hypothetical protein
VLFLVVVLDLVGQAHIFHTNTVAMAAYTSLSISAIVVIAFLLYLSVERL